ncbi:MAG: hypothetical protein IPL35_05715 [Sphingobacteriales bacterium]|nr:hypothetical protein [Sphingobacteriales bacterium]
MPFPQKRNRKYTTFPFCPNKNASAPSQVATGKSIWKGRGIMLRANGLTGLCNIKIPDPKASRRQQKKEKQKKPTSDSLQQQETAGAILHRFCAFGWSESPQAGNFFV